MRRCGRHCGGWASIGSGPNTGLRVPIPRMGEKKTRDRLIRLAATHAEWVLGYADEVWWSRLAQPHLHAWTEEQPLRLVATPATKGDSEPKALACYGLLRADTNQIWLRFVPGRPVSALTTQFLRWCCRRLQRQGKKALLMIWDHASWHISREVHQWLRAHNRERSEEHTS